LAGELSFDWDTANVDHITLHNVTPDEVEELFENDPMDLDFEIVDGEERFVVLGHTDRMRILVVAWTMRSDAIRPITAFDASRSLAKDYSVYRGS
jgi:uncharacterized protein